MEVVPGRPVCNSGMPERKKALPTGTNRLPCTFQNRSGPKLIDFILSGGSSLIMTFSMGSLCSKCVLTDVIPGIKLDDAGVCSACRAYEMQAATYERYFGTEAELEARLRSVVNPSVDYDVLLMYSGGKDSTYVLYRLVDMGFRVLALTFDNGFIPQACFENIRAVCGGCFRALTARGSEMAIEKRIPVMMTGLSRGQICATKLQPLIAMGLTNPDDMERYLRTMREAYHAKRDVIGTLVQDRALADKDAF